MSMSVGMLDHYNVSTRNLRDTVRFYEEVLGLVNGPRPPFDFPGAWLYSEGHPVLHLNDISPTDKPQRPDSCVIDHIAFGSSCFDAITQHLPRRGVPRQRGAEQLAPTDFRDRSEQRADRAQLRRREGDGWPLSLASAAVWGVAPDQRFAPLATFSAMKRGSANAATCTSGVQYLV